MSQGTDRGRPARGLADELASGLAHAHAGRALIGVDLQPTAPVAEAVASFDQRYLDRVYTVAEQRDVGTATAPAPAAYAARFAAKEAVLKLLGSPDGVSPLDVEVRRDAAGAPRVLLSGRAALLARERGLDSVEISLSHDDDLAIAVAIALPASLQKGPAA